MEVFLLRLQYYFTRFGHKSCCSHAPELRCHLYHQIYASKPDCVKTRLIGQQPCPCVSKLEHLDVSRSGVNEHVFAQRPKRSIQDELVSFVIALRTADSTSMINFGSTTHCSSLASAFPQVIITSGYITPPKSCAFMFSAKTWHPVSHKVISYPARKVQDHPVVTCCTPNDREGFTYTRKSIKELKITPRIVKSVFTLELLKVTETGCAIALFFKAANMSFREFRDTEILISGRPDIAFYTGQLSRVWFKQQQRSDW